MESFINSKKNLIHYNLIGSGHCVVLLHGYLENLEIWSGFAAELSKSYLVLTIDLPGHGNSVCNENCNTLEIMAKAVNDILDHLNISKALIVGHSMGGYAALPFAELFPSKTAGLCLFHSTPNSDNNDKKESRIREIQQIKSGEKQKVVSSSVPLRFATNNLKRLSSDVEYAKQMAMKTTDSGIILALEAMASRIDRNHVLENATYPTMMIFGEHDNLIPLKVARELEARHKKTRTVYLANSGHMGFIEEKDQALKAIRSFLEIVFC
ncbi:MAG: alpha/beta fold hydrolase [Tenuifilaceae bacterium]